MSWQNRDGSAAGARAPSQFGEIARIAALSEQWWDPDGPFRTLHKLSEVHLDVIRTRVCAVLGRTPDTDVPLRDLRILDVDCGGGLLSEPLAFCGADVTGIDVSATLVEVARMHAGLVGAPVTYAHATVDDLPAAGQPFDVIVALGAAASTADANGLLESCCRMLKPGSILIIAALNRTLRAMVVAKLAHGVGLGPFTHGGPEVRRFMNPNDLETALGRFGARVIERVGVGFNPVFNRFRVTTDVGLQSMIVAHRPRLRLAASGRRQDA